VPERDGYIPGVPCWIDTTHPDPDAAVTFYGGLFGWEFEDVMPPGSEGKYFIARIRGGDVAGIGPVPEGAPPMAVWYHTGSMCRTCTVARPPMPTAHSDSFSVARASRARIRSRWATLARVTASTSPPKYVL